MKPLNMHGGEEAPVKRCRLCNSTVGLMPSSQHDFDVKLEEFGDDPNPAITFTVIQTATKGCCASCFGEYARTTAMLLSKREGV